MSRNIVKSQESKNSQYRNQVMYDEWVGSCWGFFCEPNEVISENLPEK